MSRAPRLFFAAALLGGALFAGTGSAMALDIVHAGKAEGLGWTFLPVDVGIQQGFFAKEGMSVDVTNFGGDQKMQIGMASGSIDFGLGGGPAMAFVVKGAPVIAVASYTGAPSNIAIFVGPDSPIKSVADLKGKTIGSGPANTLTGWLVQRVSASQGWGPDGIKIANLGGFEPSYAALKTHQLDAMMGSAEESLLLQERGAGRILTTMQHYAPVFITHVVFARRQIVADNPGLVRRFLKGFFASIAFMKTHKAETSAIAESVLHETPSVANQVYDNEIGSLETTGSFDPKAVAVIKQSFMDMGVLKTKPRDNEMFTTAFVPVKP
jgi:ABC-type nitrate/sulfonate/bicarbonate transport system substrate-binding protein